MFMYKLYSMMPILFILVIIVDMYVGADSIGDSDASAASSGGN